MGIRAILTVREIPREQTPGFLEENPPPTAMNNVQMLGLPGIFRADLAVEYRARVEANLARPQQERICVLSCR